MVMAKCEWCHKNVDDLVNYTDAIGDMHMVCPSCYKTVEDCECRKCGSPVDPAMMINGLCNNCVQVELMKKSKRREEARIGMDRATLDAISSEIKLSDSDYEQWLTLGKTFSSSDMNIQELRRMWIMVKFNAAGIYDFNTIADNYESIERILDRNFSKLLGNRCRIMIASTAEQRRVVRQQEIIDYDKEVYIFKA